jgi:hypothetical protein
VQQSLYTELHPSDCLTAACSLVRTAVAASIATAHSTFTAALIAEALRSLHQPQQQQQSAERFMWPVCGTSSDSPLKCSVSATANSSAGSDSSALSTPGAAWGSWVLRTQLQCSVAGAGSAETFHAGTSANMSAKLCKHSACNVIHKGCGTQACLDTMCFVLSQKLFADAYQYKPLHTVTACCTYTQRWQQRKAAVTQLS